jgi:hypothetical protein
MSAPATSVFPSVYYTEQYDFSATADSTGMSPRMVHSQSTESCDDFSYLPHSTSLDFSDQDFATDLYNRFNHSKQEPQFMHYQQHHHQHQQQQQQQAPLVSPSFHGNGVSTLHIFPPNVQPVLSFLSNNNNNTTSSSNNNNNNHHHGIHGNLFNPHTLPERRHSAPNLYNMEPKPVKEKRVRLGSPTTLAESKRRSDEFGNKVLALTDGMATILTTSSSEDSALHIKEHSPDSEGGESYDSDDDSMEEDDDFLPPAPNTRVMDNKPRRGGRHKKDGKPREELLPPPSPRTLNDPDLMQEYRQERNRLAAKRSRERKKDYIKQLESTCKALKGHNDELSKELMKLKKEISEIKGKPRKKSIS